jgi:hypothetical protein
LRQHVIIITLPSALGEEELGSYTIALTN